jgi:ribonucleoside-triphosphate reductase
MPLMDYEEILERRPSGEAFEQLNPEIIHHWAANQIAEEYAHLRILENGESRAHLSGDIHINSLNYFVLRPFTQIWDPRIILRNGFPPMDNLKGYYKQKPAKNLKSALYQLVKWLGIIQNEFYGNQGYNFLNNFLAPYVTNLSDTEIIQEIKNFIYDINQLPLTIGREITKTSIASSSSILNELISVPAISPDGENKNGYGSFQNENIRIFKALLLVFKEIYQTDPLYSIPRHNIILDYDFLDTWNKIYPNFFEDNELLCSSSFINFNLINPKYKYLNRTLSEEYHNFGVLQNISLNLPRYALISKNENDFLEILRSNLNLGARILLKKYNTMKNRIDSSHLPFCSTNVDGRPLFKLENQSLSISLVGLNESVKFLTNYELHEHSEAIKFSNRILTEINQLCLQLSEKYNRMFILSENLSEKAINRFTQLDLKRFPKELKILSNNRNYTNSVHFRNNIEINLLEKVKIQGGFHKNIHEGAIAYFSLNDLRNNDFTVKDFLQIIAKDSMISSLKFSS